VTVLFVILTKSANTHDPLVTVHRNSLLFVLRPVTVLLNNVGFVIVPVPAVKVQMPVPFGNGLVAFRVVLVAQIS